MLKQKRERIDTALYSTRAYVFAELSGALELSAFLGGENGRRVVRGQL